MGTTRTQPWDTEAYVEAGEDMAARLNAALEQDDHGLITAALGGMARATGMRRIAEETGLGRESLYKSMAPNSNPELATVLKLVRAPGLRLRYRSDRRKGRIVRALPSTKPCKACQLTIRPHQTGMVPLLWRKRISFDKKRII